MRKIIFLFVFYLSLIVNIRPTFADFTEPVLSGGASIQNGVINLKSNPSIPYSFVDLPVPSDLRLANLLNLSAIFDVTTTDCYFGSPYYKVVVSLDPSTTTTQTIIILLGPNLGMPGCSSGGWQDTGNLVSNPDYRVKAASVGDPLDLDTFQNVIALAPDALVKAVSFSLTGCASDNCSQNVNVRFLSLNDKNFTFDPIPTPTNTPTPTATPTPTIIPTPTTQPTFTPTPTPRISCSPTRQPTPTLVDDGPSDKDHCKDYGWRNYPRHSFRNQGDCVEFTHHVYQSTDPIIIFSPKKWDDCDLNNGWANYSFLNFSSREHCGNYVNQHSRRLD